MRWRESLFDGFVNVRFTNECASSGRKFSGIREEWRGG